MQSSHQPIKPHSYILIHVCVGEVLVEYPQHWPKPYMHVLPDLGQYPLPGGKNSYKLSYT